MRTKRAAAGGGAAGEGGASAWFYEWAECAHAELGEREAGAVLDRVSDWSP